ncbi:hypothetical protein ACHAXT_008323 [Thalassiosira profunda]
MAKRPPPPPSSDAVDVVWLKKDVRLHDHAPLSLVASSQRPCLVLYLYEPDQLGEKTVHGSHVAFCNEGLVDLDRRLSGCNDADAGGDICNYQFRCTTVCHAGAAFTLQTLHRQRPIHQILCHMESGHLKSFARDKAVRRWCRANGVPIREFNQTGVTRCLKDRDDFTTNFKRFLDQPVPSTPTNAQLEDMRRRLVDLDAEGIELHGRCRTPLSAHDMPEMPTEHRGDREQRQHGGEGKALGVLKSFLSRRGANYSSGISSPNTSWTTGSRLSPYLTWGHISLRHVILSTKRRQEELREAKKSSSAPSPWLRSLASFQSRMHWRSHFIQKLETQPSLEIQDQCLAFSHLRRQPGDFNEVHFDAWCTGHTGFPFVDACMRCLLKTGWINFRMRAMLVSFATYNLWLDWRRIEPHLARVFLDFEPGIHYPQLQMQAGTTGINAMRVYNVTKQGRDQDPGGVFIRKYVPELANVPTEHIHEPSSMPKSAQRKCNVIVGSGKDKKRTAGLESMFEPIKQSTEETHDAAVHYPGPIVDEKASAKAAKDKLSAVRKQESTKAEAAQVFLTHGSRLNRGADRDGTKPKALSSSVKRVKLDEGQTSLLSSWSSSPQKQPKPASASSPLVAYAQGEADWSCKTCTFINDKPLALACSVCGSIRE